MQSDALTARSDLFSALTGDTDGLVERLRVGDEEAFATLLGHYDAQVLRLATHLLGNREDAYDAAQEAFLRLYKYRRRLQPERDIRPWLYRLTVNAARDVGKRRQRHVAAHENIAHESPAPRLAEAAANIEQEERLGLLREALKQLSPREREVVVLRDIEGFAATEVAAILGIKDGTVRALNHRARTKLQDYVAKAMRKEA